MWGGGGGGGKTVSLAFLAISHALTFTEREKWFVNLTIYPLCRLSIFLGGDYEMGQPDPKRVDQTQNGLTQFEVG